MKTCLRITILTPLFCLLATAAHADDAADALLTEVAVKVNAALPLTVEYRMAHRYGDSFLSQQARFVRKPGNVIVGAYIRPMVKAGDDFDAMGLIPVNWLEPLFPKCLFLFVPLNGQKQPTPKGFATRLLPPETHNAQHFQVVEVTNPFPVSDYAFPSESHTQFVKRIITRYYIGEDRTIRRAVFDVTLRSRLFVKPPPVEFETMTIEIDVDQIRPAILPPERKPAGIPEREITIPKSEIQAANASFVTATALAPDGKTLATGHYNTQIKLRDPATGEEKRTLDGHLSEIKRLAFSADSASLASLGQDNVVAIWETATGKLRRTFRYDAELRAFALAPDGGMLAIHIPGRDLTVYDTRTGATQTALPVRHLAQILYSPDGKRLMTASADGKVVLWDTTTWKETRAFYALRKPAQELTSASFSPDSGFIAFGGRSGGLELWDADKGELRHSLNGTPGPITALAFSPNGSFLAVADRDPDSDLTIVKCGVTLWDTTTGKRAYTLAVETGPGSEQLVFSPESETLATFFPPRGMVLPTTGIKIWSLAPKAMRSVRLDE